MSITNPTLLDVTAGRNSIAYTGGDSDNDNDVLFELDSSNLIEVLFGQTGGVTDVYASLDGTNYLATPLTVIDLGQVSASDQMVVANECAAGHICAIRGCYQKLKFLQKGATAVDNFSVVGRGRY